MRHVKFFTVIYFLTFCVENCGPVMITQDDSTSRPNTLSDDADDLQKQLDNEARDRLKFGRPKTLWVLNFPRPLSNTVRMLRKRQYNYTLNLESIDESLYKSKGGKLRSYKQSPINVCKKVLKKSKLKYSAINFTNYDIPADHIKLINYGNKLVLYGQWIPDKTPSISGGVAENRRYTFHSLHLHWPSQHWIDGKTFPLESQALHIRDKYATLNDAISAGNKDHNAMLIIANLYVLNNNTQQGVRDMLNAASGRSGEIVMVVHPLRYYVPELKGYAFYHGSLTFPPYTPAVLWLISGQALTVNRETLMKISR